MRASGVRGLVSCIVIFLDEERFLAEAIESIVAQTYTDWELILVDDGSTDGSPAVARRWAAGRPDRVRYVTHPGGANAGMSASRNLGLAHARGEYVAFLDADDVWLPHKLAEQVALMRAHPDAGMVCGATEMWHSWSPAESGRPDDRVVEVGSPPERRHYASPIRDVLVAPPTLALALYPLGHGSSPSTSSFLLRRDAVELAGGYEASFRAMYEDQAFQLKLYLRVPIYVSSRVWDRYRQHPESCSMAAHRTGRAWQDRERFLAWLGPHLDAVPSVDARVRRAYADALWPFRHPHLFRVRRFAERVLPAALFARLTSRR